MTSNINGDKKGVVIKMEDNPRGNYPKVKFTRVLSITEKYQKRLGEDGLIYHDDLLKAVSKNDIEKCRDILENCDNLPNADAYFFHPLLLAAKKGRSEILQLLLDHGVDINIRDKKDFNALHYAIQQQNKQCCNILIDKKINVDIKDKFGNLPLHVAAKEGILEIVQRLLELNQNPNVRNKKDQTPLHFACMKGQDRILNLLLDSGGRWDLKDINHWLPIHYSSFHGHYICCDILVERAGNRNEEQINARNKDKATPLILAAKKGHSRSCQSLINSDINAFDSKGNTALHLASSISFLKTVEVLLELKPNVTIKNKEGNTPIHKAAMQQDESCLKLLLEYSRINPGLNNNKQTVIHLASMTNSEKCLKYLLSNSIFKNEINEPDKDGKSALHLALNQKHSEVSELLITSGTNVSMLDEKDNLPLHIAAAGGIFNICKLLLSGDRVKKVNDRNIMGTTPLHFAAMNGSVDCCKILLTKGADLTAIDSNGYSPFHVVANEGHLEVLKLFTKKGGGYINRVVEISGDTPLHIAAKKGFYECCLYLLNNMKKDFIVKLNNKENSALDEAYNAEKDDVFYLILLKIPLPHSQESNDKYNFEQYYSFQSNLHSYFHEALSNGREIILKAIVDSNWWYTGFSSSFCENGQCPNLINLTTQNNNLTEMVYQKCIEVGSTSTKYKFQIFEDSYYVPLNVSGANSTDTYMKREPPFDVETGRLRKDAIPYENPIEHPLLTAVELEHINLMEHPLTEAYLNHKWKSYTRYILFASAFSEVTMVIILCLYLAFVKNTDEIRSVNDTRICSAENYSDEDLQTIDSLWTKSVVSLSMLLIVTVGIFLTEMRWNIKTRSSVSSVLADFRLYRVFGILVLLFPIHFCSYDIVVKETWQWQLGIWTLLISWFQMVQTLNSIPFLSVFMPVTFQFVKSFLRVLMYIILIVFIFAFIFHLLIQGKDAFATLPVAFIKTIVWVLGDLAYDDMFLDNEAPVDYPIMTNIIFLLLVTSISGFIINMIIAQPTEHLDLFRERANYHKIASRIRLFVKIDAGFNTIKNKFLVSYITVENVKHDLSEDRVKFKKEVIESGNSSAITQTDTSLMKEILEKLNKIELQLESLKK